MSESSESNNTSEAVEQTPMTVEERLAFLEEQNEGLKRVGKASDGSLPFDRRLAGLDSGRTSKIHVQ